MPTGRVVTVPVSGAARTGAGAGNTPGRTVTIEVALRHVMSATSAPAKAGLAATSVPSPDRQSDASPTRPEPVAAAARPATSRPKAVLGARRAHGAVSRT